MPKCDFKCANLLKSHFGMDALLYIAAYFQNIFSQEHLWRAASACKKIYL